MNKYAIDEQVTTLSKLIEQRTRTLGTFYVRAVITVPALKAGNGNKVKHATLASWRDVTIGQCSYLKEQFLKSNDEFEPNQFHFKFVPYSTLI